ncbi:hypothetical protein PPL_00628 [Heterostelium album PN500]|uniref:F-box domain-containing protein n=1 Tax=Heterostelium pallidum (strain ATCC 26659 / Pp 5 / PN500) TaxID=670386 RepID=D3AX00_HETP5|nr:hypothetical protein PPL_00628 [Heterostelium album PN500]EFA86823.1 hypothetical protein PPL_00628 [Heterostelium album PN500]|eukprot:XP_020438926.1 hypothetical protein PPL_00628 [Heterostelium album PN500]
MNHTYSYLFLSGSMRNNRNKELINNNNNLPWIIIQEIIQTLWYNDIQLKYCLEKQYRWLLSLDLVSKRMFTLITKLFNRLSIIKNNQFSFAHVSQSINSAYSPLKSIVSLSLSQEIYNMIIAHGIENQMKSNNNNNSSTTTTTNYFSSVIKLEITSRAPKQDYSLQSDSLALLMPALQSLVLNFDVFQLRYLENIKQDLPSLISLKIHTLCSQFSTVPKTHFSERLRKISLPVIQLKCDLPVDQFTTVSLSQVNFFSFKSILCRSLRKLRLDYHSNQILFQPDFTEYLKSEECQLEYLGLNILECQEFFEKHMRYNRSVRTIEFLLNIAETFNPSVSHSLEVVLPCPNITTVISYTNQQFTIESHSKELDQIYKMLSPYSKRVLTDFIYSDRLEYVKSYGKYYRRLYLNRVYNSNDHSLYQYSKENNKFINIVC